ncbi:tRNA pseudouridine(38-40) synthase TruA [Verrucomicrobiota bacterium]
MGKVKSGKLKGRNDIVRGMSEKQCYRMTVSYRGAAYSGWQSQPGGNAVQDVIEHALRGLHQDRSIRLNGCSRTDRGVHALGQVASYYAAPSPFVPDDQLMEAINRKLPADIRIKELKPVKAGFRPRREAKGKTYTYVINTATPNPFLADLATNCLECRQMDAIRRALKTLEGTHDFSAFTVEAERPDDCRRAIHLAQLDRFDHYVCLSFAGSSFLYRMVRRLVGALLEIGRGNRPPEWIGELLAGSADPEEIKTAPPQGLYLMQVYYEQIPAAVELDSVPFL